MKSRRQRASFVSRAILKVGILWFAASAGAGATASGTATSHPVEGDALYRLRDLIAAKNAGALYDFLNRSWLRGDIDATPDIEALALAVIRNPANDRDAALTRRVFSYRGGHRGHPATAGRSPRTGPGLCMAARATSLWHRRTC